MRAPHRALHGLYRQAATPAQLAARLQRVETLVNTFAVELIAGGRGGEILFERLLVGFQLGEVLDAQLSRLSMPTDPTDVLPARTPKPQQPDVAPVISPFLPKQPGETDMLSKPRMAVAKLVHPQPSSSFVPETHPRLTRLLSQRGEAAAQPRIEPSPAVGPGTLPDRAFAFEQLIEKAKRSGTMTAFHQPVAHHTADQGGTDMFPDNRESIVAAGQEYAAKHMMSRRASLIAGEGETSRTTGNSGNCADNTDESFPAYPANLVSPRLSDLLPPRLTTLIERIESGSRPTKVPGIPGGADGSNHGPQHTGNTTLTFHEIAAKVTTAAADSASPVVNSPSVPEVTGRLSDQARFSTPPLETQLSGLRRLIAVAHSQHLASDPATPPTIPAEAPGRTAFDGSDLIERLGAELRREAVRYGIDLTGTKP